jgi:hypothetical protein
MAKRFTDSTKWNKPFIRAMKAPYKLLWLYILDECDHAGIWQVDFEVAQVKIGEKLNIDIALQQLSGKIYPFDSGEKWFIPDFIDFQYGVLNPENRAHNSVIMLLNKYNLSLDIKPLTSPLQGAMDKDKDKSMDKDKANKEKELTLDFEIDYSIATDGYKKLWERWVSYKWVTHKFKYKSNESEQLAFNKFVKDSHNYLPYATDVLETTIASSKWEGITFTKDLVEKWKSKIPKPIELPEIFNDIKSLKSAAVGETHNWAKRVAKNNEEHTAMLVNMLEKEGVVLIDGKFTHNG